MSPPGGINRAFAMLFMRFCRQRLRAVAALPGLASLSLVLAAPAASAAVFEQDQRHVLTGANLKLSAYIGTLRMARPGAVQSPPMCTAFCVAPDMIATASHCLFGTTDIKGPDLSELVFATASRPGDVSPIAGSANGTESQNIVSGTTRLNVTPPIDAANDWAVARLAMPVCHSGGLTLHEGKIGDQTLYQIAMHRDLPDTELRKDGPCAVGRNYPESSGELITRDFENPSAILFHRCDTGPGSSGSPMLVDGNGGPEVAAINVGTYVIAHAVVQARADDSANVSVPIANTAVAARQFAAAIAILSGRSIVSTADDVRRLEALLNRRGLLQASPNGHFTLQTARALAAYEMQTGRSPSGLPTREILRALEAAADGRRAQSAH